MVTEQSRELRGAIENLVTAKLLDILSRPDWVSRLNAQRLRAAASEPIRSAEQQLDQALSISFVEPRPMRRRNGKLAQRTTRDGASVLTSS
jgi:hypothetical protein